MLRTKHFVILTILIKLHIWNWMIVINIIEYIVFYLYNIHIYQLLYSNTAQKLQTYEQIHLSDYIF